MCKFKLMNRIYLVLFCSLSQIFFLTAPLPAPTEGGNSGDVVHCAANANSPFAGYYTLDYLLTYRVSNENADIVAAASVNDSLQRIQKLLNEKLPEIAPLFTDFLETLYNVDDETKSRVWDEAAFGLTELDDKDGEFKLVPENCRDGNIVRYIQAFIRQDISGDGEREKKIRYFFVPKLLKELEKSTPLQLSFLLVHEWLWDVSKNVSNNRKINRLLHSERLEKLTTKELRDQFKGLGVDVSKLLSSQIYQDSVKRFVNRFPASAYNERACVIFDQKPYCWGSWMARNAVVARANALLKAAKNPTSIAVGYKHMCMIDENRLKCVGDENPNGRSPASVPLNIKNPRKVVAGEDFSCVLADDGVFCMGTIDGIRDFGKVNVLSANYKYACVAAELKPEKIHCWGGMPKGIDPDYSTAVDLDVGKEVGEILDIAIGMYHVCVLGSLKMKCFGADDNLPTPTQQDETKLSAIAAADMGVCGIDKDLELRCWGYLYSWDNETPPKLTADTTLFGSRDLICGVSSHGAQCWTGPAGVPDPNKDIPAVIRFKKKTAE